MKLYDQVIAGTLAAIPADKTRRFAYDPKACWKDHGSSEFLMQRDAALELGSEGEPSVNYTCVTSSGLIEESGIWVVGEPLTGVKQPTAFARIILLETADLGEETDTEKAFQAIRNLEFVRYHVFPEGYMVRVSAQSNQEQVRIGKGAVKAGISFERVGALYIRKYLEIPEVKAVRAIFVTDRAVVEQMQANAGVVDSITKTLTHILDGLPTDCGHCSLKPVCDEVEGMRELHFGKKKPSETK